MLLKASFFKKKIGFHFPKWFGFDELFFPSFSSFQQLEAAAARAAEEEKKRLQTQVELQDRFSLELEREKMVSGACSLLLPFQAVGSGLSSDVPHMQSLQAFSRTCRRLENAVCISFIRDLRIK